MELVNLLFMLIIWQRKVLHNSVIESVRKFKDLIRRIITVKSNDGFIIKCGYESICSESRE